MSNGGKRKAFERLDQHDSRLAVDWLNEFLPAQTSGIDPMLAVNALEEFFPEPRAQDGEDYFAVAGGLWRPVEDDREEETPGEQVLEPAPVFGSDPASQSEIQRAAIEFQRFAEKFHAFASECQHRGAF